MDTIQYKKKKGKLKVMVKKLDNIKNKKGAI